MLSVNFLSSATSSLRAGRVKFEFLVKRMTNYFSGSLKPNPIPRIS